MTTFALVGAGAGLGLATARRFGNAGHTVALISRNAGKLEFLIADLTRDGIQAHGFTADVLDIESLDAAPYAAAKTLGPMEILRYSPVPRADFMKPVLDTSADDLDAPLAFSVKGPVTAVNAVLPGMRALGRGTLLFVNGGSAVRLHPGHPARRRAQQPRGPGPASVRHPPRAGRLPPLRRAPARLTSPEMP